MLAFRSLLRSPLVALPSALRSRPLPRFFSSIQSVSETSAFEFEPVRDSIFPVRLNNLKDNEGARIPETRLGRGTGSGKGKTCGRGHKGQKSRSGGGVRPGFEGGQTPLKRKLPKRGFTNVHGVDLDTVNLSQLEYYISRGRLDVSQPVTIKALVDAGVVDKVKDGIKLLGRGSDNWTLPVHFEVTDASESAIEAVKKAGGSVTAVYLNKLNLRAHLKPHKFPVLPALARPSPKKALKVEAKKEKGMLVKYREPQFILAKRFREAKQQREQQAAQA